MINVRKEKMESLIGAELETGERQQGARGQEVQMMCQRERERH